MMLDFIFYQGQSILYSQLYNKLQLQVTMQSTNPNNLLYLVPSQQQVHYQIIPLFFICYEYNRFSKIGDSNQLQTDNLISVNMPNQTLSLRNEMQNLSKNYNKRRGKANIKKAINNQQSYQQFSRLKAFEVLKTVKPHQQKHNIQDQDYDFLEQSSFNIKSKLSQSKNIAKNYKKAILKFIENNYCFVNKILSYCKVDYTDFMINFCEVKKQFGNIGKLRSLWLDSQNPFAKVFRIISKQFMRKYNLGYIFNSRVTKIEKYIKFRHIIEESIGQPQKFTHIKQF